MRAIADAMEDAARVLRATAHAIEPGHDGRLMGTVSVFENGRIARWQSHDLATAGPAQWEWANFRLGLAKFGPHFHPLESIT